MRYFAKNSIILIFIISSELLPQISSNQFIKRAGTAFYIDPMTSYKYNLNDHLFTFEKDSLLLAIDLDGNYKTAAVDYYESYEDNIAYQISPFLHYKTLANFTFDVKVNIENIRDDYNYPLRQYWGDEFIKHRGTFDVAKITYAANAFKFKFGRDYYLPGVYFYENLLFSKYNYSYDLLGAEYSNNYFTISSYYLRPDNSSDSLIYNRHINVHRITVNLGNGYLAFNDLMLYGGYKQGSDIMAFNPLILLYPYRKNKKHLDGNNIMTLELYYSYNNYYIFTELVLDDWQADKKVPGDLEPTEWGINSTFGKNHIFQNVNWKINYTRVANRTFNTPNENYEKYIHKNFPIGHFLGNNFWEAKTSFTYSKNDVISDVTFYYLEYGDEALYGEFNTDYINYTVKQGYNENFPFGRIKKQSGCVLNTYYNFNDNVLVNAKAGYWLNNARLNSDFNFSVGLAYRLEVIKH